MPINVEIPNKSSFKVNEVCTLTDVKSYVLRFWESEFPEIAPLISSSGQKLYEHKDIEVILFIKKLLFEDKLSIEEVRGKLKNSFKKEPLIENHLEAGSGSPAHQHMTLAKNKLKHIISITEALKSKYNW